MFLDLFVFDMICNIESLYYIFGAFGFLGINLAVRYTVMRKRL